MVVAVDDPDGDLVGVLGAALERLGHQRVDILLSSTCDVLLVILVNEWVAIAVNEEAVA